MCSCFMTHLLTWIFYMYVSYVHMSQSIRYIFWFKQNKYFVFYFWILLFLILVSLAFVNAIVSHMYHIFFFNATYEQMGGDVYIGRNMPQCGFETVEKKSTQRQYNKIVLILWFIIIYLTSVFLLRTVCYFSI